MSCSRSIRTWAAIFLLTAAAGEAAAQEETSFSVTGRYTAQRRPRVAVLEFDDTNSDAQNQKYGASVQAMLVTYLKRKSQLVVVERQKLGDVISEWRRNQNGLTNLEATDPSARELLEKIDAIIIGSVTLLDQMAQVKVQNDKSGSADDSETGSDTRNGQRIEIDAKLLSRSDGRIIAAAQRDGPVSCLRAIVERLGVALEQEYLRPYFGQLNVTLSDPEQVTVFLTPILLDTALDEEKPPVERGATIRSEPKRDEIEPWTTDPTTYTIKNLLGGWYSMRLERPGYEGQGLESSRWEARDDGFVQIYDRTTHQPLERMPADLRRFVVHVQALDTERLDIDKLGFTFRKLGGTLDPRVKLQYLDKDYERRPERVVLVSAAQSEDEEEGGQDGNDKKKERKPQKIEKLEINKLKPPGEYGDDEDCDLFAEKTPHRSDYGRTVVTAGQTFDLESFEGGDLYIESYQGEMLPVGEYEMTVWMPDYQPHTSTVTIRDQDRGKLVRTTLVRDTSSLTLGTTGSRAASKVLLEGVATRHLVELPLDFDSGKLQESLPVDMYRATTDISGLAGWQREVKLSSENTQRPFFDTRDEEKGPVLRMAPENPVPAEAGKPREIPKLKVKTRLAVGGRLSALSSPPDPATADIYVDRDLTVILDLLLYAKRKGDEEGDRSVWLEILAGIGKEVLRQVTYEMVSSGTVSSGVGAVLVAPLAAAPPPTSQGDPQAGTQAPAGTAPQQADGAAAPAEPESFPVDVEALRSLLISHLQDLDLLILDDEDLARVREMPEVAAILTRYVDAGGALFAFATEHGDYGRVLGSSLVLRADGKPTESFELAPGEVSGVALRVGGKKVKVKTKRVLPELERLDSMSTWRVLAFGKGRRDVRILERGYRDQGGYVAVWLDHPASFRGHWGGTVTEVEEVRARVERYVLDWARFLMQRRYGKPIERRPEQQVTGH